MDEMLNLSFSALSLYFWKIEMSNLGFTCIALLAFLISTSNFEHMKGPNYTEEKCKRLQTNSFGKLSFVKCKI